MKTALCMALFFVLTLVAGADATYYVDCNHQGGFDGANGTEEKPYETIQEAINRAGGGNALTTIYVKPGVYNKGEGAAVSSWGKSRIGWNNKKIHIISTGGADKTFIVGEKSTDAAADKRGIGPGAMRCVTVYDYNGDTSPCNGSVIKGFTLCGGRTVSDKSSVSGGQDYVLYGGAVAVSHNDIIFADCVITDCAGKRDYSVAHNGTFVRCLFTENDCPAPLGNFRMYASAIVRNTVEKQPNQGSSFFFSSGVRAYNSTIFDNLVDQCTPYAGAKGSDGRFYNSILWHTGTLGAASDTLIYAGCHTGDPGFMSTATADLRLRNNAPALGAGDAANLANFSLHADAAEVVGLQDYAGSVIPQSGAVAAGAIQLPVTPAAGGLTLLRSVYVDGRRSLRSDVPSYVYPEFFPTQYQLTAHNTDESKRLSYMHFGDSRSGGYGVQYDYRFPTRDDKIWVMPPPNPGQILTNKTTKIAAKVYVSPDAEAEAADGSRDKPYRTFAAAIAKHAGEAVYIAMEGVHNEDGGYQEREGYGRSRLWLTNILRITSECGPEKTFLVGAKDTTADADAYGRGPNAVRALYTNMNMQQIQGFTITGCYSGRSGNAGNGGAVYGNDYTHVDDCIVSNNFGVAGGAVYNGWAERSLITKNYSTGNGILYATRCVASIVADNAIGSSPESYLYSGYAVHSVVVGRRAANCHVYSQSTKSFGSLFLGGDKARVSTSVAAGNVYDDFNVFENETAGISAFSMLADPDNGDYRPLAASPLFSAGVRPQYGNYGTEYAYYARTDFEGNRIRFDAESRPVTGAFMTPTDRRIIAIKADNGGIRPGTGRIMPGEDEGTVEISLVPGATRPIVGVSVNGTERLFGENASLRIEVPPEGVGIEAIYTSDWYVAADGSDDNDGFTRATPKTLKGGLENAYLRSGDTVWAEAGEYEGGLMRQNDSAAVAAVAVVKSGVTLKSIEGAAATTIRGRASDVTDVRPADLFDYPEEAMAGMGRNAVRCVYLNSGARLEGFTVAGGYTRMCDDAGAVSHGGADYTGGGVYGVDNTAEVRDCVVTGCAAYRGGGIFRTKVSNCLMYGNRSLYGGGGASDCIVYGSHTYGNVCYRSAYAGGMFFHYHLEQSTVEDGLTDNNNTAGKRLTVNVLATGRLDSQCMESGNTFGCVFNSRYASASKFQGFTGIAVVDESMLQMDSNHRPVPGANAAVDAYRADLATWTPGANDVFGGQRVYNGAMDIGASEGDWRPVYAKDLAPRRITVSEATENVVESADRTVEVASGEKFALEWKGSLSGGDVEYSFKARVGEGAALKVYLNGEELAASSADGAEKTFAFKNGEAVNALRFETEGGTGSAELYAFERLSPAACIFIR